MSGLGSKWVPPGLSVELRRRKRVRLLVVSEDCEDAQSPYYSHLKDYAELCSHEFDIVTTHATSGEHALLLLKSWEPSVILVDAHLPDMNSLDVVRIGSAAAVPVVLMSDSPSEAIENSAREQGAAAYMSRTENPDDLESVLQNIVDIASEIQIKH